LGFPAQLGVDRMNRQAVGLDSAITATLAYPLIDHHALSRLDGVAALAFAAKFCGAFLIMNENCHPGRARQR